MTIITTPRILAAPAIRLNAASCWLLAAVVLFAPGAAQAKTPRGAARLPIKNTSSLAVVQNPKVPGAARVALARARQLLHQGREFDMLAERELQRATTLAPQWLEARRELARFYSRRADWPQAAAAWRRVLFLQQGAQRRSDREAKTQFERARRNAGLPIAIDDIVELGQNLQNPLSDSGTRSTRAVAQTTPPRLAQTDDAPSSAPNTVTGGTSASPAGATSGTTPDTTAPEGTTPTATPSNDTTPPVAAPEAPAESQATVVAPGTPDAAPLSLGGSGQKPAARTGAQPAARNAAPRTAAQRAAARRAAARRAASQRAASQRTASAPSSRTRPVSRRRQAAAWPLIDRATRALQARNYAAALRYYQRAYATDPNNPYAQNGVPETLSIMKRYPQAAAAYRRLLAVRPNDLKAQRGLADVLTYSGRYAEALPLYKKILGRYPRDFQSAYQVAQILTWTKRYQEAFPYYRRALALRSNDAAVWTTYGEALSFANEALPARNAFQRALQIRPGYTPALLGVGNLFLYNRDYPNAIARYRAVLRTQPRNTAALVGLGDALAFSDQPREAFAPYRAALAIDRNARGARLGLGRALILAGDDEAGLAQLRMVLAREPNNAEALNLTGVTLGGGTASPAQRAQSLALLQRLLPVQRDPDDQAQTLSNIARIKADSGDAAGATAAYLEALRRAPGNTQAATSYAQFLIREDKLDEALGVLDTVTAREPDNVRALILEIAVQSQLGNAARVNALLARLDTLPPGTTEDTLEMAYALRAANNPEAANRVLNNLISRAPQTPGLLAQIARFEKDSGSAHWPAAVARYGQILQAEPNNLDARFNLAEVLYWQKKYAAAKQEVAYVLQRDPKHEAAQNLDTTLELRLEDPEGTRGVAARRNIEARLKDDPQNVPARLLLGQVEISTKQFKRAIEVYSGVVKTNPNNLEARLGLARSLYYDRQVDESIAAYRELIRLAPADAQVKLELAQIFLDRNLLSEAELLFNQVLGTRRNILPPTDAEAARIETRRNARVVSPTMWVPLQQNEQPAARTGRANGARRNRIRLAQADAPSSAPNTITGTSPAPATMGEPVGGAASPPATGTTGTPDSGASNNAAPPAVGDNPTPSTVPPDVGAPAVPPIPAPPAGGAPGIVAEAPLADQVAALRGLGEVRRRQLRYAEAIEYFRQGLALDADNTATRIGLAQTLRAQGNYEPALTEVNRVLAAEPESLPGRVLHAQLQGDTGKPQEAQKELDALLESIPESPPIETWLTLSQAFTELRNYDAALQVLDLAQKDPAYADEPSLPLRVAETLTAARRWDQALAAYDRILAADARNANALLGKSRVYNYASRLEEAEALYRQTLQVEPENYQALVELADILSRRSNWTESIALYRQAIVTRPADLATRVEMARTMRYNRQYGEAEATLNQLLEADPNYAPAYTERGILHGTQSQYDTAIADLNKALSITPQDLTAQLGLAEVLGYSVDRPRSIELYRAALLRAPDNEKARTELGLVLSYERRYDEALRELNTVLTANPQNVNARIAKADVFGRSRRVPEAVAIYQDVLRSDPDNRRAQLGLAEALINGRRYNEAIAVYDALIAAEPNNRVYRIARGRAMGYGDRDQEGIAALRAVVQADPNDLEARYALAEAITNGGDREQRTEAVALYRSILSVEPSNTDARLALGRVLSYNGNYDEARAQFNQILQVQPRNKEALLGLADTERFAGNPFEARELYQRVLEADPAPAATRTSARSSGNGRGGKNTALNRRLTGPRGEDVAAMEERAQEGLRLASTRLVQNTPSVTGGSGGTIPSTTSPGGTADSTILNEPGVPAGEQTTGGGSEAATSLDNSTAARAREGLSALRRQTSPSITISGRNYRDSNGVRIRSFLLGPTFRLRAGTFGITGETGTYEDEGVSFRRRAINLLVARRLNVLGGLQARLLVNRVNYSNAPSRSLFDLLLQRSVSPRQRYFVNLARREIVESLGAVQGRILARELRAGADYPLGRRFDLELAASLLDYSDGNNRTTLNAAVLYRLRATNPVLRIGLSAETDDTRFETPLYYTPQGQRSLRLVADYTFGGARLNYGLSAGVPLYRTEDDEGADNRGGARTLFGFINYDINEAIQLFLNGGFVDAEDYNSTDFNLGATYFF